MEKREPSKRPFSPPTPVALVSLNAHIVGLIELENNPSASLQDLVNGLNAATAPGRYTFIDTGVIGTDAIKVGLVYQPAVVSPVGTVSVLDASLDPRAITTLNRPALAQTFRRLGVRSNLQRFTVVVASIRAPFGLNRRTADRRPCVRRRPHAGGRRTRPSAR